MHADEKCALSLTGSNVSDGSARRSLKLWGNLSTPKHRQQIEPDTWVTLFLFLQKSEDALAYEVKKDKNAAILITRVTFRTLRCMVG
jgi:hypothetical protein